MSPEDKELLRHAVLDCLATRHPAALPIPGLLRRLKTELDFPCSEADVQSALDLLISLGHVHADFDPLGASKWYSATGQGLLAAERC